MATRNYQAKKFENHTVKSIEDALTIEEALQININNKPFTVSMRTPGNDACLVRGMLHTEGIIKNNTFFPELQTSIPTDQSIITIINLTIPENELGEGYSNSRSLLSVSSCGMCGRTEIGDMSFHGKTVENSQKLEISILDGLFLKMKEQQVDFQQSGGTHAAAAFTLQGKFLSAKEDIGRHNAVDKIVGELLISRKLKNASVLTVSGRVSYEIIIKCFKAKIPFLAAVSAPSSLAVDFAKELGITLFGFTRDGRTTCYSNPQQVIPT